MRSSRPYFSRFIFFPLLLILVGCAKEENPVESNDDQFLEQIESIVIRSQEAHYDQFENMISLIDTTEAVDSIANLISVDANVDWVKVSAQGIGIQYKNGLRGGLFINPKDIGDTTLNNPNIIEISREQKGKLHSGNVVPVYKKIVLINPHYSERMKYTNELIANYNEWFPDAGYETPIIYKGNQATLDLFAGLSNFGVIHIYSHGWAWPNEDTMTDVYLETGEKWSATQLIKYIEDYRANNVIIGTSKDGSKFYLSSKFLVNKNNFTDKNTLIFGGFCYSFEGQWSFDMNAEKVGGYFGFNWSVYTSKNQGWAKDLFFVLLDKSSPEPITVTEWIQNPIPPKQYYDAKDKKDVHLWYTGKTDLALIKKAEVNWPWRYINIVFDNVDVLCNVSSGGTYLWDNLFFSHPQQYTSTLPDGITFVAEWDTTYDGGSTEVGQLSVKVDTLTYMVTHFQASKYYEYKSGGVVYSNQSLEIEGQNIPMTWKDDETLTNSIEGPGSCTAVYHFNFIYNNNVGTPSEYTYTSDSYNCDDLTYIAIYWDVNRF